MNFILALQTLETPSESLAACPSNNSWAWCGDHTGNSSASDIACG